MLSCLHLRILILLKGSPQVRRRFIDMEIGQVSPVYLHDMSQYHKITSTKKSLFKEVANEKTNRYNHA